MTGVVLPIDPAVDRRNGNIYVLTQILTFFSAPVLYVGIVQAEFFDKLGASATIANLPSSTYLLGSIMPLICSWLVPARFELRTVQHSYGIVAGSFLLVIAAIFLPAPNGMRITAVVGQGLLLGMLNSVINTYLPRCVARGTSEAGRARAFKYAFGIGPFAAVLGSLLAQLVLSGRIPGLPHPYNFGLLYLIALPCMATCAVLARRLRLPEASGERIASLVTFLRESLGSYLADRRLVFAWIAYLLWYCALGGMTNVSLYTREAIGRTPLELAGLIMALRFGCKALAGFGLGLIAGKYGARSAMLGTVVLVGLGLAWPFFATGYGYLAAFGFMGGGELGGVYFFNYIIAVSQPAHATRNMALLALVAPISSLVPALHGSLTDRFGFQASFAFGAASATVAVALLLLTAERRQPR